MTEKLSSAEIRKQLAAATGWRGRDRRKAMQRTYTLPDFRCALGFVGYVGELAENLDHHPDIDIRYNRVTLTLSTHDAGGLTEKDFRLAALVDGR